MNLEKSKLLADLLTEIKEKDGGFIPEEAWKPIHKLVRWTAVEVLIVNSLTNQFLLNYRDTPDFKGWHIIGGYVRPGENITQASNRMAKEEAGLDGVANLKLIAVCPWKGHPYSFPLSVVFVCEPIGLLTERDDLKWFSEIPENIAFPEHKLFLRSYAEFLKNPLGFAKLLE
ncbi:MAG TPA: NUDIX hydrolase [Candidatus Paceibacterota bacterium]|nr:NUDIX hydrolase [Candidatus Paceibacterota bacterium]